MSATVNDSTSTPLSQALCPWLETPFRRLESARLAGRLGHAWLLAGPAGIGKLNLALVMAERLLHPEATSTPATLSADTAREALVRFEAAENHDPDLYRIHPAEDRETIGIEQIRELAAALSLKSLRGRAKVAILSPAEAMTHAAANSLLKTLEEPTPETFLWLVSHQPGRLPATIRSRCQQLLVTGPSAATLRSWLGPAAPEAIEALTPFEWLRTAQEEIDWVNSKLEKQLTDLSRSRLDPMQIADEWLKGNLRLALEWLAAEIRDAIRARVAPGAGNLVTDRPSKALHNAWGPLSTDRLWAQLAATERLQDQQGKGRNEDLAVRVLLLGFAPR